MRIHHLLAVPAALALLLAAATSSAQDKPVSGAAAKPKAGTPLTSKSTRSATQTPLQRNAVKPKAAKKGTVAGKVAPPAVLSAPAEERKESSCHSRESDA